MLFNWYKAEKIAVPFIPHSWCSTTVGNFVLLKLQIIQIFQHHPLTVVLLSWIKYIFFINNKKKLFRFTSVQQHSVHLSLLRCFFCVYLIFLMMTALHYFLESCSVFRNIFSAVGNPPNSLNPYHMITFPPLLAELYIHCGSPEFWGQNKLIVSSVPKVCSQYSSGYFCVLSLHLSDVIFVGFPH